MPQKLSVEEIRQIAEAAISARQAATDAKAAAEAADGTDADLNAAQTEAERLATEAEAKALALSHNPAPTAAEIADKKRKLLRKKNFIERDLQRLGEATAEEDDEDEQEEDDLDKPVTRRDLKEMETAKARKTSQELANAITDPLDRAAVITALSRIVPSGDPEKDFKEAVAVANIDRNSKILEEVARKPVARAHSSGAGAPSIREETFVPTAFEQQFIAKGMLTKADVIKARKAASQS